MFKNKRETEDPNKMWFCVALMADEELSDEEYDALTDDILDRTDNVIITYSLTTYESNTEQAKILNKRFNHPSLSNPCFIVNKIRNEDIDMEIKRMEEKFKWKKLLGLIPHTEYLAAGDRANLNFQHAVLYTDDIEKVIEFLINQSASTSVTL